jgi:FkbM family methyltransferase
MNEGIARRVLRELAPRRLRSELYRARELGLRGYVKAKRGHRRRGGRLRPRANEPFDIGAPVPIVLHASTLHGIESHLPDAPDASSELAVFMRLAEGHEMFLDIGAGAGVFAAVFCAVTGARAYVFEPSPEMFDRLSALLALNPGFAITPLEVALGAEAGVQAVEPHGAQYRGVASASGDAQTMSVDTLDAFVARHALRPDFAKLDVEGMELDALRGGARTFAAHVDTLMLEVHPRILGSTDAVDRLQQLLRELGFELFTLAHESIADLTTIVHGRRGNLLRALNVVCVKPASGAGS